MLDAHERSGLSPLLRAIHLIVVRFWLCSFAMDMNHKDVRIDGSRNGLDNLESPKVVVVEESDGEDESQALLLSDRGGLSTKPEKPRRKVQWLDRNGDKLAEIVEFQPSDVSDSDEEDSDSCICRIM